MKTTELKPIKTVTPAPVGSGDLFGSVVSIFIIVQSPGKAPITKRPLGHDADSVARCLRQCAACYSGAVLTVAEVTHDQDLWLTAASEWIYVYESALPNGPSEPRGK